MRGEKTRRFAATHERNRNAQGAIYISNAPFLHVSASVVSNNSASGSEEAHGGIIIRRTPGSISNTLVSGNVGTATGRNGLSEAGGIDTLGVGGTLTLTDSQVLGNKAVGSDAQVGGVGAGGTISGTVIRDNVALATGDSKSIAVAGGLAVYGPLTLEDSAVQGNQTLAPEGSARSAGIHLFSGIGILTATGTNISGNSASGENAVGGGIVVRPGTSATLDSSPVRDNSVNGTTAFGGGIANQGGSASLTASPVMNNAATGVATAGGGLFNDGGSFLLNSNPVLHNAPDNCYPLGTISGCTG